MTSLIKRSLQRTNRFARDIKSLPKEIQQDAYNVAKKLEANIFDPTLNVRELFGFKGYYRVIVSNQYRMIFSFDSNHVYLLRIAHRKDIYRKFEI